MAPLPLQQWPTLKHENGPIYDALALAYIFVYKLRSCQMEQLWAKPTMANTVVLSRIASAIPMALQTRVAFAPRHTNVLVPTPHIAA